MLNQLIADEATGYLLVFARLGSAMMVLPFFGDGHVNSRVRLFIALGLTLGLTPVLAPVLPTIEQGGLRVPFLVVQEVVIGLFIGGFVRLAIAALHIAGGLIAMQMGFAAANFFDANSGAQSSAVSNFLTLTCITAFLAIDGHHGIVAGLAGSYQTFEVGHALPQADAADAFSRGLSGATALAFQIAAPITLMAMLSNVALGVLNRMVPSMHVIFVALPLQIMLGLVLLGVSVGTTTQLFSAFLDGQLLALGS